MIDAASESNPVLAVALLESGLRDPVSALRAALSALELGDADGLLVMLVDGFVGGYGAAVADDVPMRSTAIAALKTTNKAAIRRNKTELFTAHDPPM